MTPGFLLLIELRKEEFLDDVILALTSTGASGALVIDAVSMERMMAFDLPIFAGFQDELTSEPGFAKVVLARAGGPHVVELLLRALADGGTDFQRDELGRIALLPLAAYVDASTRAIPGEGDDQ